jgi:MFS family permease
VAVWKRNLLICWIGTFATAIGLSQLAPVLPLYIEQLGEHDPNRVAELSGLIFGISFIVSAIFAPIWGMASDKYGRKPMLLRASLGMAIVIFSFAFAKNVQMLIIFRAMQGVISGYSTACTTLIATQTDREHAGYAMGILSSALVSGTLIGPTFAGFLAERFTIEMSFFITSGLLLFVFVLTLAFVKEDFVREESQTVNLKSVWKMLPQKSITISLLVVYCGIALSNFAIQPIMTMYVSEILTDTTHLPLISGIVFSVTGLASMVSGPYLGRLSDKVGAHKVLFVVLLFGSLTFIPQAFAGQIWMLAVFRFLTGIATGGMTPAVNTALKKVTPDAMTGVVFGYSYSAHYVGIFAGSVLGGQIASHINISTVFLFTFAVMLSCAVTIYFKVYRPFEAISPQPR